MSENANVGRVFNLTGGGGGSGSLKLVGISVKNAPTKTTYKSGESFDPTGMIIEANYGYGLTSEVTGYSCSPAVLTDGVTAVTITYTENRVIKTVTTPVTVEKVLTGIAVTTNPTKMAYRYLESFDPTGMAVTANFSDGSTDTATGYTYPATAFSTLGTQAVELGYTYEGVTKTTSLDVTVSAIQLAVPAQSGSISYNGSVRTPTWDNNYDDTKMSVSGDTSGTDADTYTATFELVYGYLFPNGTNQATADWVIDQAVISAVPTQSNTLVADGTVKTPEWSGYVEGQLTKGGDLSGTDADDYTMTFTPTANYKWWDGTTGAKNATWTITSVLVTIPSQKNIPTYSPGVSRTPEWDDYDAENSSVSVTSQINAGEHYEATFTLIQGMWEDGTTADKVIEWKIERATLSTLPAQANAASLKYDGNPKTPSWDANYDSDKMTLEVTAQTLVGSSYTASFTPNANYKWWDDTVTAKTATWAIALGDNTLTLSPTSLTLNTSATSGSIFASRLGDGVITAESSDTSVATVGTINQSTGEIPINSVNDTTGTATITVHVAAGTNYAACTDETATVTAQFVTIYGVEWDWTGGNSSSKGTRTDGAENFSDPSPAVNNGNGSSPFDNLYPWSQMTKETRTGGVMVKEPKYWYKWTITDSGKKIKLQIADGPVEGFHIDPVNMDRGDGLGELDFSYIGRYHCATGTYKSETNKAQQVSITRSTARTSIHNLGSNIWQMDFAQMWYVGMLYLVEFADWNGQTAIGYGCSASGSKENNGKTDAMSYHTGTTAANRTIYGYTQYRNIEGWWDNVYDWMDGCYYNSNGLNVILDPSKFSDSANGTLIGSMPSGGYPDALQVPTTSGFEWAVRPLTTGGSNTTCVPDDWSFNGGNPCLRHGGGSSQDQNHGPFCVYYSSASNASTYVGCRLQERPPKAA